MLALPWVAVWSHAPKIAVRGRRNVPAEIVSGDAVFRARPIKLACDLAGYCSLRHFHFDPLPLLVAAVVNPACSGCNSTSIW